MKDYAYFYKDENGDREYDAEDITDWLTPFFTTGVFNGNLQVTANNNMTVTIGTGYCNVNGKVKHFINQTTLDLETASGTLNRIDNVILRRDDTQRDIYLMIVTGGNAATPTPPVLVRNDNIYDLKLAEIYIQAGTIKVTQANITDTRMNSAVCGWVAATVTEIEFAQITAQFQTYMEEFEAGDKAEFEAWFQEMKDQLTTDAAGNLQTQINTANTNIAAASAKAQAALLDITDQYSASKAYAIGDYCIYNNVMYKCTTAITVAEIWNASHWVQTNIASEIDVEVFSVIPASGVVIPAQHCYRKGNIVVIQFYCFYQTGITNSGIVASVPSKFKPPTIRGWIPCGCAYTSANPVVTENFKIFAGIGMTGDVSKIHLVNDFALPMFGASISFSYSLK